MHKKLRHIFDETGKFRFPYDPMRVKESEQHFHSKIFDEDGGVHDDVVSNVYKELKSGDYRFDSDIVVVFHASQFAMGTKGNYSAIYYWR